MQPTSRIEIFTMWAGLSGLAGPLTHWDGPRGWKWPTTFYLLYLFIYFFKLDETGKNHNKSNKIYEIQYLFFLDFMLQDLHIKYVKPHALASVILL
jgi:hypothetical protein